jgi:hypothetical protein
MLALRSVQQGNHCAREEFLYELKAGPAGGRLRRPSSAGSDTTVTVGPASPSTPTRQRRASLSSMLAGRLWPCRSWLCLGVRGGDDLGGHVGELA